MEGTGRQVCGIAANIGIHFFDMLCWVFGPVQEVRLHSMTPMKAAGYLEFANARVRWFLSIDRPIYRCSNRRRQNHLPQCYDQFTGLEFSTALWTSIRKAMPIFLMAAATQSPKPARPLKS